MRQTDTVSLAATDAAVSPPAAPAPPTSLIGPRFDFFCLGGLTLLVVPLLLALPDSALPAVAALSLALAHVINHPHFAHSYQIFYRGYAGKLTNPDIPAVFRLRYLFAGVIVPLGLASFLLTNFLRGDMATLGLAGNLMAFLVGWHYVKQGYGMLVVQSVLQRRYFKDAEKHLLVINSYACWLYAWLLLNHELGQRSLWGIDYFLLSFDSRWLSLTGAAFLLTTLLASGMLWRKFGRSGQRPPWTGLFAYVATLYVWMFAALDPMLLLVVPALHSLQYLTVVWRFELNYQAARTDLPEVTRQPFGRSAGMRFARFLAVGLALGYFGFWALPEWLSTTVPANGEPPAATVFLFMCWIFINVHHYFLDNVMWRKENPDTGRYLFAAH